METKTHTIKTSLKGLKRWAWKKNLSGFFSVDDIELNDSQVRSLVNWAIEKGYVYDCDIPCDEAIKFLNLKNKVTFDIDQLINGRDYIIEEQSEVCIHLTRTETEIINFGKKIKVLYLDSLPDKRFKFHHSFIGICRTKRFTFQGTVKNCSCNMFKYDELIESLTVK